MLSVCPRRYLHRLYRSLDSSDIGILSAICSANAIHLYFLFVDSQCLDTRLDRATTILESQHIISFTKLTKLNSPESESTLSFSLNNRSMSPYCLIAKSSSVVNAE
ncbi:hypothetical protein pCPXV0047 [Cowpox virus]|uniref:Uncharacterized protein n=1 Tax=Cowpox virus TaxID=10243 RepID=A0A0K2YY95_COWPX|nr:hypothetical protein pCPXV0047 [Cowpox virus]SNB49397.1 hypothetical protein pCPXV0047 [Cowpox virus]